MRIAIDGVTFAYDGRLALEGIELDVSAGELSAVVGPNGSGKTTLLKTISGVLAPQTGAVYLDLKELSELKPAEIARKLAALEQERRVGFDFTVRELIEWGRIPHRKRLSRWRARDEQAVRRATRATRTEPLQERSVQELSGGERQRVFIAMALAQAPQVLLLDEPTAHLDLRYQVEILDLVKGLASDGLTVVAALHDLNLAARYADRVAVLAEGRLVAQGPPREVLTASLIGEIWGVDVCVYERPEGLWVVPLGTPPRSAEKREPMVAERSER